MTAQEHRQPHREICAICGHVNRVSFWVPDDIWKLAIHEYYQNSIVCLSCFTAHADERSVAWEHDIKFFPTSFVTIVARNAKRAVDGPTLPAVTKATIEEALCKCNGHRARAARMLGIGERTLYRKLRKYALEIEKE